MMADTCADTQSSAALQDSAVSARILHEGSQMRLSSSDGSLCQCYLSRSVTTDRLCTRPGSLVCWHCVLVASKYKLGGSRKWPHDMVPLLDQLLIIDHAKRAMGR